MVFFFLFQFRGEKSAILKIDSERTATELNIMSKNTCVRWCVRLNGVWVSTCSSRRRDTYLTTPDSHNMCRKYLCKSTGAPPQDASVANIYIFSAESILTRCALSDAWCRRSCGQQVVINFQSSNFELCISNRRRISVWWSDRIRVVCCVQFAFFARIHPMT